MLAPGLFRYAPFVARGTELSDSIEMLVLGSEIAPPHSARLRPSIHRSRLIVIRAIATSP